MNAIPRIITMFGNKCFLREVEKILLVWRKQHNQVLRDLQYSPDIIKVVKCGG
jgi:hypothetical protein